MSIERDNFGYLDKTFQYRLLNHILHDNQFADSILEILDPNYFDEENLRMVGVVLKDAYDKDESIPDIASLTARMLDKATDDHKREIVYATLRRVEEANKNDAIWIKETAIKFCKQQELKKAIKAAEVILERGSLDDYSKIEDVIRSAMEKGDNRDNALHICDNIDDILADDFRDPILTGIPGLDDLMKGGLAKKELGVILAAFGIGKEQPNSAKIYTPSGYTTMGLIKVGDKILGSDGKEQNVIGVYPQGFKDIYKIEFNDGTSAECGLDHLWAVNELNQRNRSTKKDGKNIRLPNDETFKVLSTGEIMKNIKKWNGRRLNYRIPTIKPVEFNEQELTINPYVLGVLLGDGSMNSSRVTTVDNQIIKELKKYNKLNVRTRCRDFESNDIIVKRCIDYVTVLGISSKLKELELKDKTSSNKFIPKKYLYNSKENRISLLQGLLDTDGYANSKGRVQYTTVSKQLADDVRELVLSLGGFCGVRVKQPKYRYKGVIKTGKISYILTLSIPEEFGIKFFRLKRKQNRVINRSKYAKNKFIKSVSFVRKEEATCIMVDNSDHLYVTNDFILTHNTTALTKIANTARNLGKNVLQIIFEDQPKVIQRKHLACWTKINPDDFAANKERIKEIAKEMDAMPGGLVIKKFTSGATTIPMIRQYIRRLIARGFKPDVVTLDYIDCVIPSTHESDVNVGEGKVMRQFEALADEFDVAAWTAIQGNRSSIKSEIVESDQMGGSIKRGQIGHFIMSFAKSLDQKVSNRANIAILKSRFSKDGFIITDVVFDNGTLEINMTDESTISTQVAYGQMKQEQKQNKVTSIFEAAQKRMLDKNKNDLNGLI